MINRYQRQENEDSMEYLLRLTEIKLEEKPSDLEWQDIVNNCNLNCHYDSLRKAMQPEGYGAYFIYKYFKENAERETLSDDKVLKEYRIIILGKRLKPYFQGRSLVFDFNTNENE